MLKLYYPVYPFVINQHYGDNSACRENNGLPVSKTRITGKMAPTGTTNFVCPPGFIELYPTLGMKGHTGMDIRATHGQPIYHCGPEGVVEEIQTEVERGLGVGVITDERFLLEGGNYFAKLRYWHLKSIEVRKGDRVRLGQLIGYADNTGVSAGDHLHFEVKPVERAGGDYFNIAQNNGYFGSIDPWPFFCGDYANNEVIKPPVTLFDANMRYGQSSSEIRRLQALLKELGYFTVEPTGYYGVITMKAVFEFQSDHVRLNPLEYLLAGSLTGVKTRTALNNIIKLNK